MKELKEAWAWLKTYGTEQQKALFRPVHAYIKKLEKRIEELEKIHDQYMAPQMFAKPPTDKEILVQIQVEKNRQKMKEEALFKKAPLKERLQNMIKENKVGSDEWNKTLKWNTLTEQKAMEIANGIAQTTTDGRTKD